MKRIILGVLFLTLAITAIPVNNSYGEFDLTESQNLIEKGDLLYREGKYEEASNLYDRAYSIITKKSVPAKRGGELPEEIMDQADGFYKDGMYGDARILYKRARDAYLEVAENIGREREAHLKRLEEIKALRSQIKDKKDAKVLKEEYITELKERREKDKLKKRAESRASVAIRKEEAAGKRQARREEKVKYRDRRAEKRVRIKAEKKAIAESKKLLKEEEKAAKPAKKKKTDIRETPVDITPLEVAEEIIETKKERARRERREEKLRSRDEKHLEKDRKREEKQLAKEKRKEERRLAKDKKRKEKEQTRARKRGELEAARGETGISKAEKRAEKIRRRDEKKEAVKIAIRQRLDRIEESLFKKRQEKLKKIKDSFKVSTIKKAARCKNDLSRYELRPSADIEKLERTRRLVERADSYFGKEKYKEAGKLYDRAVLTLRGKYH